MKVLLIFREFERDVRERDAIGLNWKTMITYKYKIREADKKKNIK